MKLEGMLAGLGRCFTSHGQLGGSPSIKIESCSIYPTQELALVEGSWGSNEVAWQADRCVGPSTFSSGTKCGGIHLSRIFITLQIASWGANACSSLSIVFSHPPNGRSAISNPPPPEILPRRAWRQTTLSAHVGFLSSDLKRTVAPSEARARPRRWWSIYTAARTLQFCSRQFRQTRESDGTHSHSVRLKILKHDRYDRVETSTMSPSTNGVI